MREQFFIIHHQRVKIMRYNFEIRLILKYVKNPTLKMVHIVPLISYNAWLHWLSAFQRTKIFSLSAEINSSWLYVTTTS